eukprot:TRINITY_DN1822_c1_g3_i2.p1 TRINITY_DN1822_c1_g3~~TRINITY_DN1822_c1_g3_i2.p1  ORF type:complete len:807 (+),score=260.48 TRINITY_DN1822_c1_g3_i2:68-2488(+)
MAKRRQAAALSFVNDGEEDAAGGGAVSSRLLRKRRRRMCADCVPLDDATVSPTPTDGGGEYSEAALARLRRETLALAPPERAPSDPHPDPAAPPAAPPSPEPAHLREPAAPPPAPIQVPAPAAVRELKRERGLRRQRQPSSDGFIPFAGPASGGGERRASDKMLDAGEDERDDVYHHPRPGVFGGGSEEESSDDAARAQFERRQLQAGSAAGRRAGPAAPADPAPPSAEPPRVRQRAAEPAALPGLSGFDAQVQRLRQQAQLMRDRAGAGEGGRQQLAQSVETCRASVARLEAALERSVKLFHFLQGQSDFFDALGECFEAKLSELDAALAAAYAALSRAYGDRGRTGRRKAWAEDEAEDVGLEFGGLLRVELLDGTAADEHGRDVGWMRRQEKAGRTEARVAHRARKRAARRPQPAEPPRPEGWSSSDESEGGAGGAALRSELAAAAQAGRDALADVAEEFGSIDRVARRLRDWREDDPETYLELARPSLGLCFAPFVKRELLEWLPPAREAPPVARMHWYQELQREYGESPDPAERRLPAFIVSEVVAPHFAELVRSSFDPLSARHHRAAAAAARDLMGHLGAVPEGERRGREVCQAVLARVRVSVDSIRAPCLVGDALIEFAEGDAAPPLSDAELAASAQTPPAGGTMGRRAAFHACRRWWWQGLKLMGSLSQWGDLLSDTALASVCGGHLLGERAAAHLMTAPAGTFAEVGEVGRLLCAALDAVPARWVAPQQAEGEEAAQQARLRAAPLRDLMGHLGRRFKALRAAAGHRRVDREIISAARHIAAAAERLGDHATLKAVMG